MNIHYFEIEYSFFWFLFELNLNKLKNLKNDKIQIQNHFINVSNALFYIFL